MESVDLNGREGSRALTQQDLVAFAEGLAETYVFVASEATGAPEAAWGDVFFYYGEGPIDRRQPFATIVVHDYAGFDTASGLDRPGVFRLNAAVGPAAFEELIGYPAREHPDRADAWDYAAVDSLIPHPVHARQSWVSILNPAERTADLARALLTAAHARAAG